jgi:hypothetical protein
MYQGFEKHLIYILEVVYGNQTLRIYKRFREFRKIRNDLVKLFPKQRFTVLPKKSIFRTTTKKEDIRAKKKLLTEFFEAILVEGKVKSSETICQAFK